MRGATSRATACPRRQRRGRMEPKAEGKGDAVPHIGPRTYKQRDGTVKDERGDPGKSYTPPLPLPENPPSGPGTPLTRQNSWWHCPAPRT